ncbi:UNVERIFIED_CONTAM: hypothetical protein GTU68_066169, partial [Idotea baltica]|nr:hypothetical protein [Idotea baltica]
YTYPIQIAQYGLSHYSKLLEESPPKKLILEDGLKRKAKWKYDSKVSAINRVFKKDIDSHVLKFSTVENFDVKGISVKIPESAPVDLVVLNMYLHLAPNANSSITVTLQMNDKKSDLFHLHYICSNNLIET